MVAAAIGVLIVITALLRHDGDIAGLVKFGAEEPVAARTAHVEEVLGRDVATVGVLGHDGSMFFLQALDPFFLDPDEHAVHLDRPEYRAQRMLFPLLAGFGGLLPPEAVLWSMAVVNIAAISLGSLGTARIAGQLGGSLWLGLAFAVNPGIIFEFDISGAGILAFTCAIWGTVEILSDRPRRATAWFLAAVLAREVMLLYVAGACLHRLVTTRRIPWMLGTVPALGVAGWASYVRLRLDSHDGVREVQGPNYVRCIRACRRHPFYKRPLSHRCLHLLACTAWPARASCGPRTPRSSPSSCQTRRSGWPRCFPRWCRCPHACSTPRSGP